MRKALCVGVSLQVKEQDHLPSIAHCENDANEIHSLLTGFCNFESLMEINPTVFKIKELIWDHFKELGDKDFALLYFSGHGKRNNKRKLQLCTTETDVNRLVLTSISFDEILGIFSELSIGSTLIILDCCASGAVEHSIYVKGNDETLGSGLFEQYEDEICLSKGLSVLCSSLSYQPSVAHKASRTSAFTECFIEELKNQYSLVNGWIPISLIANKLVKRLKYHSPRLLGENPNFPLAYGRNKPNDLNALHEISFKIKGLTDNNCNFLFYGMIVLKNFRAWIVLVKDKSLLPKETKKMTDGIYMLENNNEFFKNKILDAKKDIEENFSNLLNIAKKIDSDLLLLYPVSILETTYNRFISSDKKYILKTYSVVQYRTYPSITNGVIPMISIIEDIPVIFSPPNDYLSDAFGVTIDKDVNLHGHTLVIKENSFLLNSKYLAIHYETNIIFDFISVGKKEIFEPTLNVSTENNLIDFVARDRRRNRNPLTYSDVKEDTVIQEYRKQINYKPNCEYCMDEKYTNYRFNTRLYRVPCRYCNSKENNQWTAFNHL